MYIFKRLSAILMIILILLAVNACTKKRSGFERYNLRNPKIYDSIYVNFTPIYHIEKLYGKPNYKINNIWYYQFVIYNNKLMRNENVMIALEIDNNTVINKTFKNYTKNMFANN
jgi:hypothetical protein